MPGVFYNEGQFIERPMPLVQADSFLTLHYRLAGPNGADFINTFGAKPATLSMGSGQLSQALEDCLMGLPEGRHAMFELAPGTAFGPRDEARLQWVARKLLDKLGQPGRRYCEGDVVQFPAPDGSASFAGAVRQVGVGQGHGAPPAADAVLFDFNHPLAGMAVRFEVKLIGVL
jgi:FKBP-type peptidyl-prolyl cis-trans isomerase SlpA